MATNRTRITPVVDPEWSPRQRQVLDMLAKGYTNGEIAQRLGISLDGAKWHVREVMSKLGVDSREDAAAYWRQRDSLRGRLSRAKRGLTAVVAWRVALTALLGVAVLVAGVAAALMLFGRGDDTVPAEATPTGTAAPTSPAPGPTSTPTATETAGGEPTADDIVRMAVPLTLGEPVPFPDGIALYALDATWEGPSAAFRRYYRAASGDLRTDDLLVSVFPQGDDDDARALVGVVRGPNAGEFAAGLCHGLCYGEFQPVTVTRSLDGGLTWEEIDTVDVGSWGTVVAIEGGSVLIREIGREHEDGPWQFTRMRWIPPAPDKALPIFPAGTTVNGNLVVGQVDGEMLLLARDTDDRTLWLTDGSGGAFARIPVPPGASVEWVALAERSGTPQLFATWHLDAPGDAVGTRYLGVLDLGEGSFTSVFRWDGDNGIGWVNPVTLLGSDVAVGWAGFLATEYVPECGDPTWVRGLPAIIDLASGEVSPIAEWTHFACTKSGGPYPAFVLPGPFARVTGAGTCLNVREEPSTTAAIRGCYADGVLLRTAGETQTGDGIEWLAVTTPAGDAGWASTEYLEY